MPKGTNCLFLAEVGVREKTIRDDAEFFKELYGYNPLDGYNVQFMLYQSAYKTSIQKIFPNSKSTFICYDEIHEICSHKRILFVLNSDLKNVKQIGLSATIDYKTLYEIQGERISKLDVLKKFCPVIFTYSINEAIDDKNTRELKFFILKHNLDIRKNIKTGPKDKQWLTSEKLAYEYLDREFKKALFLPNGSSKDFKIRMTSSNRARFLYALESKIPIVKELISKLQGKTLVFGLDNQSLTNICPTAIVESNKNLAKDLDDFKNGITQLGASNRILRQGENIKGLANIIFHSYYGKFVPLRQCLGRSRKADSVGIIVLIMTSGTQEEVWFKNATEGLNSNWIYTTSVDEIISKI